MSAGVPTPEALVEELCLYGTWPNRSRFAKLCVKSGWFWFEPLLNGSLVTIGRRLTPNTPLAKSPFIALNHRGLYDQIATAQPSWLAVAIWYARRPIYPEMWQDLADLWPRAGQHLDDLAAHFGASAAPLGRLLGDETFMQGTKEAPTSPSAAVLAWRDDLARRALTTLLPTTDHSAFRDAADRLVPGAPLAEILGSVPAEWNEPALARAGSIALSTRPGLTDPGDIEGVFGIILETARLPWPVGDVFGQFSHRITAGIAQRSAAVLTTWFGLDGRARVESDRWIAPPTDWLEAPDWPAIITAGTAGDAYDGAAHLSLARERMEAGDHTTAWSAYITAASRRSGDLDHTLPIVREVQVHAKALGWTSVEQHLSQLLELAEL